MSKFKLFLALRATEQGITLCLGCSSMPKQKNTYALLSHNTCEGEEIEIFGPFANDANATDWATIGRGAFDYHTFRGTGTLEECEQFAKEWRESE